MSKSGWRKAVDEAEKRLGSRKAVARKLGITPQAMAQWPARGPKAEHVPALEALSGVPRHEIRPDIYEPPASPPRKSLDKARAQARAA